MSPADLGFVEITEAFAAQVLAVSDALGLDEDLISGDGGAIALGHPWGASGAVLLVRLAARMAAADDCPRRARRLLDRRRPGRRDDRGAPGMSEIRFEQVSHDFGAERVVDDVTLVLRERRIGIVGANGSGKSTLARMINGLVTPASGRVVVDGLDVARQGREVRRRVGFVFTNADNQIVMPTVREDVAFTLRRHRLEKADAAARVDAALDRVGLTDLADRPAHRLSGGQKQLLAIASVLVAEPAIVVADEPTTLLDARNARRVAEHFESLDQQLVVVSHQLELLESFDRVVVMEGGRIVADDVPDVALDAYRALIG